MNRDILTGEVCQQLGRRKLYWAGIRSDDAASLTELPQYSGSFSILGSQDLALLGDGVSYESLAGTRHDLERWDIQEHTGLPDVQEFRSRLLDSLMSPSILVTYRPSRFLSAIFLARRKSAMNLSPLAPLQSAFEYKPWVEHELAKIGIPIVPWMYFTDRDIERIRTLLNDGPLVLRRSRTSGGEGMWAISSPEELQSLWFQTDDGLLSVTKFLEGALPINVGATVWKDGVTVHFPSVQLIGVPECNSRPFGYCGNDFDLMRMLDSQDLEEIHSLTDMIGSWLAGYGYLGSFGVDYLLHKDRLLVTEINPRFQGSTLASARLSSDAELPCLYLEHLAANLQMSVPVYSSFEGMIRESNSISQIVIHSPLSVSARIDPAPLVGRLSDVESTFLEFDVLASPRLVSDPGAVVARVLTRRSITRTGYELDPAWSAAISGWSAELKKLHEEP